MSNETNEEDDSFSEVYVKYSSSSLSTYVGLNKPLVRGSDSSRPLSTGKSVANFPDGQDQVATRGGLRRPRRRIPLLPISRLYEPRPGSMRFFFEMYCHLTPVTLFQPNLAPAIPTSVGWSKLCHNGASLESEDGLLCATRARFPLFLRMALVVFVLVSVDLLMKWVVDQIMDSVVAFSERRRMARLPSCKNLSCVSLSSGSVMGFSLLATQTGVKTGILLNHMPRYQPGEEVVVTSVDLLMLDDGTGGWNWKKPSANLLFLEMSLSPAASVWPAARVSPFAAAATMTECKGACYREDKSRRPPSSV